MFPRDTVAPVHCESVSKVTKYIKPLDTEGSIKSTFYKVEFGYCIHDGCGTTWEEHTIATTMGLTVLNFETTHIHRNGGSSIAIWFHSFLLIGVTRFYNYYGIAPGSIMQALF